MKRICLLFLLCLVIPALAQVTKPIKTRMFETYVPDNWEDHLTDTALFFTYPTKEAAEPEEAHIRITPSKVSEGMGLDSFAFMAKHSIESDFPELKLADSKQIKLGKLDGHRFDYRGVRKGKKYQITQVFCLSGSKGFTIEFRGTEADFSVLRSGFENMLRAFKPL